MYQRSVNPLKTNSFFLFGARGTGKSTLLQRLFSDTPATYVDLLEPELLNLLQVNPAALREMVLSSNHEWCIIDEVQKVPALLDVAHSMIEKNGIKFALTGSSARKLKRDLANMLGGRAFLYKLFPLTHIEMGDDFNLEQTLKFGSLAKICSMQGDTERRKFLKSYVEIYLKEEVLVEQIIRSLPPFRKFLHISAAQDTEVISYSSIARDVRSNPRSIMNYYSILEDTLLGFFLEPYHTSIRKRQRHAPKFYWFDTGVRRALAGTIDLDLVPSSFEYGSVFESYIVNEINRLLTYSEKSFNLSYLRVDERLEIDLILERPGLPTYLIEIKSSAEINENHTRALERYSKEISNSRGVLLSRDPVRRRIGSVDCINWRDGLKELGFLE
jgi:predicted AAA+ superfamily ATPase